MEKNHAMSVHRAEVSKQLSPMGQKLFRYIEFDEDEELLVEIRKHPIGLFFIWVTGAFITAAIVIATAILALNIENLGFLIIDNIDLLKTIILTIGVGLGVLGLIMTVITAVLYSSNVIFVTNEKIAEVAYASLFNRRVKQLGIGNVEDVTVNQRGILPRIFNYGGLIIETAGEMQNPAFTYVPKPNDNAQIIVQAHEEFVQKY